MRPKLHSNFHTTQSEKNFSFPKKIIREIEINSFETWLKGRQFCDDIFCAKIGYFRQIEATLQFASCKMWIILICNFIEIFQRSATCVDLVSRNNGI